MVTSTKQNRKAFILTCAALSAWLMLAGIAAADDSNERITYGVGIASCGTWSATHKAGDLTGSLESWVTGFVSGVEYGRMTIQLGSDLSHIGTNEKAVAAQTAGPYYVAMLAIKATDPQGIVAWVTQYCGANPLKEVSDAAGALVLALRDPAAGAK